MGTGFTGAFLLNVGTSGRLTFTVGSGFTGAKGTSCRSCSLRFAYSSSSSSWYLVCQDTISSYKFLTLSPRFSTPVSTLCSVSALDCKDFLLV